MKSVVLPFNPLVFSPLNARTTVCINTDLSIQMLNIIKDACSIVPLTYYRNSPVKRLQLDQLLFLSLIKLRLNLSFHNIGKRFGISKSTSFYIFSTFLPALHKIVFQSVMQKLPSRIKCKRSLPPSFKGLHRVQMRT
jgi:hypothetical protein